jgi:DNA-binding winged helix-turn-helix (wHTH) protein
MAYEFGRFLLDVERRELRLGEREVPLQPRAFDVLVHLVRNRDRVVSKRELLDAVWADVVVSDGSLKRAVSLIRSALRSGGMADAVRTYARNGYRFDTPGLREGAEGGAAPLPGALAEARAAYRDGRWSDAVTAFVRADAHHTLAAADLERWAETAQLAGRPADAILPLERAVAAHAAARDPHGVARGALALAQIHFERMEISVGRGWLRRAGSVLPDAPLSREHGTLAGLRSRFAVGAGEYGQAVAEAERAVEIGRELDDLDIELYAMSYLGMALIANGEVERGLAVHEEAAATTLSGAASPLVNGLVYCGIIWTCRNRADWGRADEWTRSFTRWCAKGSFESFSGNCRLHRAELLHHRGELEAARAEAHDACDELPAYAQGDAQRVLGDLLLEKGDLEAAEIAFRRAHELGWDPNPGFARLQVAKGRPHAGVRALERALRDTAWGPRQRRPSLLTALVHVALADGATPRARAALEELESEPGSWDSEGLRPIVAEARAALLAERGDRGAAISQLRSAVPLAEPCSRVMAARLRIRLAELYAGDSDRDAARLEIDCARGLLDEMGAAPLETELARVAALCR